MPISSLTWGSPEWMTPAIVLGAAGLIAVFWSYRHTPGMGRGRVGAAALKCVGIIALALCLVEPQLHGTRPRRGANIFLIVADDSQSLQIKDPERELNRGEFMAEALNVESAWQTRMAMDFNLRRYSYGSRLRALENFSSLDRQGTSTSTASALEALAERYAGRPLAGILLFSDGLATDAFSESFNVGSLPPVYPVLIGEANAPRDISLTTVKVSQSNFEDAPVTVLAEITARGMDGETIQAKLLDADGDAIESVEITVSDSAQPLHARFRFRPATEGTSFYTVEAFLLGDDVTGHAEMNANTEAETTEIAEESTDVVTDTATDTEAPTETEADTNAGAETRKLVAKDQPDTPSRSTEATLVNNRRGVVVDRGKGPYRILYVSGRPNWEHKFLRRAASLDQEIQLVSLLRVAKREPKFDFRSRRDESTNPLFRGFGNKDDEDAEQYDEPVLLRIGTDSPQELRDGFPKSARDLFRYQAVILDDVEAAFFTADQKSLLAKFVAERGGGILMLGGMESFARGGYDRTPIADLLPVYLDRRPIVDEDETFQLALTREGWLQPWIRLRKSQGLELRRLENMPKFKTLNAVQGIKPGASVFARARGADGETYPALVAQRFGRGRSAALLVGDLWRWGLGRDSDGPHDFEKAWRQLLRWLISDVPGRLEVSTRSRPDLDGQPVDIDIRVRNSNYEPMDNADVVVNVTTPGDERLKLDAEPSDELPGLYRASLIPRELGAYRLTVAARSEDGETMEECQAGFFSEGEADEFRHLAPDLERLSKLADTTAGEVVALEDLDTFVASLPNRKVPVTERWIYPLWHTWAVFLLVALSVALEWGWRRWKGYP